jgi:hypothetical protein
MKTLYESILDDEDVLVGDLKKDINNPFIMLYSYYLSNGDKFSYYKQKEIANILKSLELPLKSTLTAFEINIDSPKSFSIRNDYNDVLCYIVFDGSLIYNPKLKTWDKNDYKVCINFEMNNWGKKGVNFYKKIWKKKYNLSETLNPNTYILK